MANVAQSQDISALKTITFRVRIAFWERVHLQAVKARISVRELCTEAITQYLDRKEEERSEEAA